MHSENNWRWLVLWGIKGLKHNKQTKPSYCCCWWWWLRCYDNVRSQESALRLRGDLVTDVRASRQTLQWRGRTWGNEHQLWWWGTDAVVVVSSAESDFYTDIPTHRPHHLTHHTLQQLWCLGGAAVRASDFRSSGRGFDSRPELNQGT